MLCDMTVFLQYIVVSMTVKVLLTDHLILYCLQLQLSPRSISFERSYLSPLPSPLSHSSLLFLSHICFLSPLLSHPSPSHIPFPPSLSRPAGDGEQRPLADPPGDTLFVNAVYVVTGSKCISVREGLDSSSEEIMTLHPGKECCTKYFLLFSVKYFYDCFRLFSG